MKNAMKYIKRLKNIFIVVIFIMALVSCESLTTEWHDEDHEEGTWKVQWACDARFQEVMIHSVLVFTDRNGKSEIWEGWNDGFLAPLTSGMLIKSQETDKKFLEGYETITTTYDGYWAMWHAFNEYRDSCKYEGIPSRNGYGNCHSMAGSVCRRAGKRIGDSNIRNFNPSYGAGISDIIGWDRSVYFEWIAVWEYNPETFQMEFKGWRVDAY